MDAWFASNGTALISKFNELGASMGNAVATGINSADEAIQESADTSTSSLESASARMDVAAANIQKQREVLELGILDLKKQKEDLETQIHNLQYELGLLQQQAAGKSGSTGVASVSSVSGGFGTPGDYGYGGNDVNINVYVEGKGMTEEEINNMIRRVNSAAVRSLALG